MAINYKLRVVVNSKRLVSECKSTMKGWTDMWKVMFNAEKCVLAYFGIKVEDHQCNLYGTVLKAVLEERHLDKWMH